MPASDSSPVFFRRRVARPGTALAVALAAAALTSCSSGADSPSETASTPSADEAQTSPTETSDPSATTGSEESASSTLRATERDFVIELSERDLQPGDYTIEVANEGGATHDLVIEDASGNEVAATEIIAPGGSGTVEVTLEPGEYIVYCSVDGHRGRGMELTVAVE